MEKSEKTNVMRLLDAAGISYNSKFSQGAEGLSGAEIARMAGEDPDKTFKTLVTVGKTGRNYVFVIPVEAELDLKKAAKASGEKSIEMIKQKELLPLTGYVHGGCSPIGMKKLFPTWFDETAILFDTIYFSAGKIGAQVEICPDDINKIIPASFADITKE